VDYSYDYSGFTQLEGFTAVPMRSETEPGKFAGLVLERLTDKESLYGGSYV
jgi:hypothetical protein